MLELLRGKKPHFVHHREGRPAVFFFFSFFFFFFFLFSVNVVFCFLCLVLRLSLPWRVGPRRPVTPHASRAQAFEGKQPWAEGVVLQRGRGRTLQARHVGPPPHFGPRQEGDKGETGCCSVYAAVLLWPCLPLSVGVGVVSVLPLLVLRLLCCVTAAAAAAIASMGGWCWWWWKGRCCCCRCVVGVAIASAAALAKAATTVAAAAAAAPARWSLLLLLVGNCCCCPLVTAAAARWSLMSSLSAAQREESLVSPRVGMNDPAIHLSLPGKSSLLFFSSS